ncbi:hypothetical protein EYZ11_008801 [Aspergillus tanneri]|uniref:Uncharacterized protein n=1 Tax=Aspergillus tanneri TaxID=1220188 RepID=A0A4S3JBP0_9EURO|nr:hypothetical protein EYZ11_008801 [Aspergillus tanneri]
MALAKQALIQCFCVVRIWRLQTANMGRTSSDTSEIVLRMAVAKIITPTFTQCPLTSGCQIFFSRDAGKDFEKGIGEIEGGVQPQKYMDKHVHPALFSRGEHAEV